MSDHRSIQNGSSSVTATTTKDSTKRPFSANEKHDENDEPAMRIPSKRPRLTAAQPDIVWKEYRRRYSRVGEEYQVMSLPSASAWIEGVKDEQEEGPLYDQIWDRIRGEQSEGLNQFLQSYANGREDLAMHALHMCDYNVGGSSVSGGENSTMNVLMKLVASPDSDADHTFWRVEVNRDLFRWCLLNDIKKKDFQSLAAKLGMTVNRCLVYYYRYFKSSPDYKEFKRLIVGNTDSDNDSESSDHQKCCCCGNYGHLIFCDGCNRAYHPSCVKPPLLLSDLESVDKWYCPEYCKNNGKNERQRILPSSGLLRSKRNKHRKVVTLMI